MSLVGTRPPTPDEIEQYEVGAWQRLNVKPGMTGEWQVNGRSNNTKFEDVIKLDLRYQENWSFFYDVWLIIQTVLVLFSQESPSQISQRPSSQISQRPSSQINEILKSIEEIDSDIESKRAEGKRLTAEIFSILDSLEHEIEELCGTNS